MTSVCFMCNVLHSKFNCKCWLSKRLHQTSCLTAIALNIVYKYKNIAFYLNKGSLS